MASLALSFNEVKFNPIVQYDGQIWLSSVELAKALDYKSVKSVSNLYNSNKDEFSDTMTQVIESMTSGNYKKKSRIFSLRGCHLIAMFARTSVAKEFRKWVLDILDKEVGVPVAKTNKSHREPLTRAVNLLVSKTKHLNYSEAYKIVHQRFNVEHIEDIPFESIPIAVEYVHHLIALYSNADKTQSFELKQVDALARHMLWLNHWWSEFGSTIIKLSPTMGHGIHDHFKFGAESARQVAGRKIYMPIFELSKLHDWHREGLGYKRLLECSNFSLVSE